MEVLRLPADIASLEQLRSFALQKAERWNAAPDKLNTIELLLEEVLMNVISYAYPGGSGDIELICASADQSIQISVHDRGIAFNPLKHAAADTSADIDERRIGGLGIHFLRSMADTVSYERRDGQNRLTFSVNLTKPAEEDRR